MVLYPHVQGRGCGPESLHRALQDLRRVQADGFVEVVLEEDEGPSERCSTITARPFTWCRVTSLRIRPDPQIGAGIVELPGREGACQERAPTECERTCARFAAAVTAAEMLVEVYRERCLGRCDDVTFMACARAATTHAAVDACLAPAERSPAPRCPPTC